MTPGLRRRIRLHPTLGHISAGLEDDFHHFEIHLSHSAGRITHVATQTRRYPWSTCWEAGDFLERALIGQSLQSIASLNAFAHCTHLYDLAALAAAHAADDSATQFDMFVADRIDGRTVATLARDGAVVVTWTLQDSIIQAPDVWSGWDLKQLSSRRAEIPAALIEPAFILRRAIFISGGRAVPENQVAQHIKASGVSRLGACYRYQAERSDRAERGPHHRRDFSETPDALLADFAPRAPLGVDVGAGASDAEL